MVRLALGVGRVMLDGRVDVRIGWGAMGVWLLVLLELIVCWLFWILDLLWLICMLTEETIQEVCDSWESQAFGRLLCVRRRAFHLDFIPAYSCRGSAS